MEAKVDREQQWDITRNNGRIMKAMVSIVLRHTNDPHESSLFSEEEVHEAEEVLERYGINPAESRIVEWLRRAAENLTSISLRERQTIQWTGSDKITDLNEYRTKDES